MRFSRLSPEVDAEIRRRLEAGDSIGAIVRALHVSRASVTLRKPRRGPAAALRELERFAYGLSQSVNDAALYVEDTERLIAQARADVDDLRRHYFAMLHVLAAMKPCVHPNDDGPDILVPDVVELRRDLAASWAIVEADLGKG